MDKRNYPGLSDGQLLQLTRAGDETAFSAIYRKYWPALYNTAFKRLSNHLHCHDVLQNVFLDLWARKNTLKINNLYAYLYGAVKFQVYKLAHKEHRHSAFFDTFSNILTTRECDEHLLDKELGDLVNAWICALPEKRRQIFKMHYEMYFSTREIASKLNISQKTVQNQLHTASADLRSRLLGLFIITLFLVNFVQAI